MTIANILTGFRIVCAAAMVLADPFSVGFWIFYVCGGLSDIFDGAAARASKQHSEAGARLDSIADAIFAAAIGYIAIVNMDLPVWLWICAACIALLRLAGYAVGFFKYRAFCALHTLANKATGALIFAFPVLYAVFGLTAAGIILCAAAFLSSLEEVLITISSDELKRDRKGLLI